MDRSHHHGPAARPRSSASNRTRLAGSKNIKTNEWVLLHQHSLSRTVRHKETLFIIHKQKFRPRDVQRKIRRAIASQKAVWSDPESLPPLTEHLELRTPSPEPTPIPPVNADHSNANKKYSPQLQEADLTFTGQESLHASPDSKTSSVWDPEEETHRVHSQFLSQVPLSKFVFDFGIPNLKVSTDLETSSRVNIVIGSSTVEAGKGDSVLTFLDRLQESREADGECRLSYLEMIALLLEDHQDHFSGSHFLETVVLALDATPGAYQIVVDILDELSFFFVEKHAARALGAAACRNNFIAVGMFDHIAHLSGTISRPHPHPECHCEMRVIGYSHLCCFHGKGEGPSDEMIAYLLGRGAKLTGSDECLLGLLDCHLRKDPRPDDFLPKVQSVVECIHGFADVACETGGVLETCLLQGPYFLGFGIEKRFQAFEYLLDRSAKTTSGSLLAAIIYMCGPLRLIEKLLDKTADVNAYYDCVITDSYYIRRDPRPNPFIDISSVSPLQAATLRSDGGIIELLLSHRGDVNCPARGSGGVTPLQGICSPKEKVFESYETHENKFRIVKLLLDRGANVNAAPAWNLGLTALQAVAYAGDMELAKLLVSRGANVNAPACKFGGGTALAMAARRKHVDMVRYLLGEGAEIPAACSAVSSSPVAYDDNKIVMDLLRDQAPELVAMYATRAAHSRDYREYEAEWEKDPTYVRKG